MKDLTNGPSTAIRSPIVSTQGTQLAFLTITATISVPDVEAALQEVLDANSTTVGESGFQGVLERLSGFMRLVDLAADVGCHYSVVLLDHLLNELGSLI